MKFVILPILIVVTISLNSLTIKDIEFKGNFITSDQELASVIISYPGMEYDQKTLLEDMQRIAELYENKGYYLAKIMLPAAIPVSQDELSVQITIKENSQLPLDQITFTGNTYITTEKLEQEIKTPLVFLKDLTYYRQELIDYYNQNSFYFASMTVENIALDQDKADLIIRIDEGDYCKFDQSIIRGNKVTQKKTVLQLSRLNKLDQITPRQLKQAESNLLARPYIKSCQIMPVNKNTLLYDIEEGHMTAFSGLIGYDNDAENEARFTGYIDLDFENLWGTDRSVGFFWENRQNQHSAVELNYHESGWDIPLGADIHLYREEVDSTWIEVSYDLEVYWFDLYNKAGLYLERENIYAGARRPVIIDETSFLKSGVFWSYTVLDHPQNPQSGYFWSLKYYYIWSKTSDDNSGRQAAEIKAEKIFPVKGRWFFYSGVDIMVIENKSITEFDRFEVGGSNSIRGFLEKQFNGFRVGWTNLELRYILSKEARLSLNFDLGNVENMKSGNEIIYSLGMGLRTATPLVSYHLILQCQMMIKD